MAPRRGIEVRSMIDGPVARVEPALPEILGPLFEAECVNVERGGPRGYSLTRGWVAAYRTGGPGGMWILAGCVPEAASALEAAGHRVAIDDRRDRPGCSVVDEQLLADASADERDLLGAVTRHRRGRSGPAASSRSRGS
jgi:hypothetical protein